MSEDNETPVSVAEVVSSSEVPEEKFEVAILRVTEEPSSGTISGRRHERVPVEITQSTLDRVDGIVNELNVLPFGSDSEGGPTAQDLIDTVQYNLNHAALNDLGLPEESIAFIKESGLFT